MSFKAIAIPASGPIERFELPEGDGALDELQRRVGGHIEAVPIPSFITDAERATGYVHDEGKYTPDCDVNWRATDFYVPGVGLQPRDYIAGTLVLCGFDPETGENADVPESVALRVALIEREAG